MTDDIEQRLDRLESIVTDQQETIQQQRERISELEAADEGSPRVVFDGGNVKVLGDISADDATGVLGKATGSGTTYGVRGEATNGYGLSTPDDAQIGGTAELNALRGNLTGNQRVTDLTGTGLSIDSGTLVGTYVQESEPAVGNTGTLWMQPTPFVISAETSLGATGLATAFGDDGSGAQFLYAGDDSGTVSKIDPGGMSEGPAFSVSTTDVYALAYGGDGFLYAGYSNGTVYKLDPDDMTQENTFSSSSAIRSLAYGSDGRLYAGGFDTVYKIDPSDMGVEGTGAGALSDGIRALAYAVGGSLYAGAPDVLIKINTADMSQERTRLLASHGSVAYGTDGFVYADTDSTVGKFNSRLAEQKLSFAVDGTDVDSLAYGPNGYLYVGDNNGTVYELDPGSMSEVNSLSRSGPVGSITYGTDFVYAGVDSSIVKIDPDRALFVSNGSEWIRVP